MPEQFLHGVELVEIDAGPRPIQTVRSSVIGIVGTAPNSQTEVKATLATGTLAANNAITWTAKLAGVLGNKVSLRLVDPKANSAALAVTVADQAVTVSLATSVAGAITTTATQLMAAIAGNAAAFAVLAGASTGASTGASAVAATAKQYLSGGLDEAFPLNTPVLVAGSRKETSKLGADGTLPDALDSIFDQAGAVVIVVRVEEGATEAETIASVIGGTNAGTGQYEGMQALRGAESVTGVAPRILIAPGFTHQRTGGLANGVVAEMIGVANALRAVIIKDGPSTTDDAAKTDAGDFGDRRVYVVDPRVTKLDANGAPTYAYSSAHVAGLICKSDNERGFWWSPSNQTINGIVGTERSVEFALGDVSSRANLLNEAKVATIIRQNGYRLWGNRTLSADPKWAFLSVVRTADMIQDSILRAHLWAVDRNITKTYFTDVVEGVNDYLRHLVQIDAILGGTCWADPGLNAPDQLAQGNVYFDFDFTPPAPAERVTFRSHMVNDYFKSIFE
jgi:uncharacterized protein